jgi:hypothetical protein
MSLNIEGALRWNKNMKGLFTHDDGTEFTHEESKALLLECKAKGWRVIPCGDCEGFDYQKGCPGHKITEPIKTKTNE